MPKHFSLEEELKRLQNIHTTEILTLQNLADVIMMLSMRLAEATTLRIIYYEPDKSNPLEWYNPDYFWYCTGYIKNKEEAKNNSEPRPFLSMEKNPKRAKELLTWIQNTIAIGKLRDPVYSINGKRSTGIFSKFLKPYGITTKRLRKIGGKHASRVHGGQNPTSQHLTFLSRIAIRHRMDRHNPGMYYAEDNNKPTGDFSSHNTSPTKNDPSRSDLSIEEITNTIKKILSDVEDKSGSSDSCLQQNKSKKNKVKYFIIESESDTNSDNSESSTSSSTSGSEDTHVYKSVQCRKVKKKN
ncbi:hypothetical protein G9A89_000795 [Geosiphon pyriformis]|nr:hypothetical protein G9A89_000795 [Geosiphon pyriformis]